MGANKAHIDVGEHAAPKILHRRRFIEVGNPLEDDLRLLQGPRITDEEEIEANAIKKSASNQALNGFRWGGSRRKTGLSKTGLCITVPSPRDRDWLSLRGQATGRLPTGPILQEGAILYTYSSSSSGGLRTSSSFGAIGDHLATTKQMIPNENEQKPQEKPRSVRERASWHSNNAQQTHLKSLVESSSPDDQMYELLILGEEGPLKQPIQAQVVRADQFHLLPRRRRSLSDLVRSPQIVKNMAWKDPAELHRRPRARRGRREELDVMMDTEPELWQRAGPSYRANLHLAMGHDIDENAKDDDLDPSTFTLPRSVSKPLLWAFDLGLLFISPSFI